MLMSIGAYYVRWMDDYKVMGRDDEACRSVVTPFDHFLVTQGLTRSVEETRTTLTRLLQWQHFVTAASIRSDIG